MLALTLRQPWCNAVLYLNKTIENRKWAPPVKLIGQEFLIHAAKGMTKEEFEDAIEFCEDVLGVERCYEIEAAFGMDDDGSARSRWHPLLRGGIVGRARLVGFVPPRPDNVISHADVRLHYPESYRTDDVRAPNWRWHMANQYGFLLEDVKATPFVPCAGMLGFWEVSPAVLAALEAAEREQKERA